MTGHEDNGRAVQEQPVETEALEIVEQARAITINTDEDYQGAGEFLRTGIKAVRAKIAATFDPIIKAAHTAHKEAIGQRKIIEDPVKEAERIVKAAMGAYHHAQQAERRRIEEAQLKAAREVAEAEQLERAVKLEEAGWSAEAEAVVSQPVAPVIVPQAEAPKAAGVSVRTKQCFRVTDPAKINAAFMIPDEKKIRQIVNSMGADAVATVGEGLEVWQEEIVSARA